MLFISLSFFGCSSSKMPIAIEAQKMQVIYEKLPNPITLVYNGIKCDDLLIDYDKTKARIEKNDNCEFVIYPKAPWKEGLNINIYKKNLEPKNLIETRNLRIDRIPRPVASLNGNTGGSISTGALKAVKIVSCVLENFVYEGLRHKVSSFDYLLVRNPDKKVIDKGHINGQSLTPKLREQLFKMSKGDMVHFYNIEAYAPQLGSTLVQNDITLWID
jgi:hypothetical protein